MARGDTNPLQVLTYGLGRGIEGYAQGRRDKLRRQSEQKLQELRREQFEFGKEQAQQGQEEARSAKEQAQAEKERLAHLKEEAEREKEARRLKIYERLMKDIEKSGIRGWRKERAMGYARSGFANPDIKLDKWQTSVYDLIYPEPETPSTTGKEPKSKMKQIDPRSGITPKESLERGKDIFSERKGQIGEQTGRLDELGKGNLELMSKGQPVTEPGFQIGQQEVDSLQGIRSGFREKQPGGAGAISDSLLAGKMNFMTGLPISDSMAFDIDALRKTRKAPPPDKDTSAVIFPEDKMTTRPEDASMGTKVVGKPRVGGKPASPTEQEIADEIKQYRKAGRTDPQTLFDDIAKQFPQLDIDLIKRLAGNAGGA